MDQAPQITRMARIFEGSVETSGRFDPLIFKHSTVLKGTCPQDWRDHVEGRMGLGICPLRHDRVKFAAMDIDDKVGLKDLALLIQTRKLPLVACRSKGGGTHAYLFFKQPVLAREVPSVMGCWARLLGVEDYRLFPKQKAWLNMPYFNVENTRRYAFDLHKGPLTLTEFLDTAEERALNSEQWFDVKGAVTP